MTITGISVPHRRTVLNAPKRFRFSPFKQTTAPPQKTTSSQEPKLLPNVLTEQFKKNKAGENQKVTTDHKLKGGSELTIEDAGVYSIKDGSDNSLLRFECVTDEHNNIILIPASDYSTTRAFGECLGDNLSTVSDALLEFQPSIIQLPPGGLVDVTINGKTFKLSNEARGLFGIGIGKIVGARKLLIREVSPPTKPVPSDFTSLQTAINDLTPRVDALENNPPSRGTTGANGAPGPQGPQGKQGPEGKPGAAGKNGTGGGGWAVIGTSVVALGVAMWALIAQSLGGQNPSTSSGDSTFKAKS